MPEITDPARSEAELQKLRLEILKLQIEVASSERLQRLNLTIKLLPTVTVLVTVLGFVFTVWQYRSEQREKRASIDAQSAKDKVERDDRARKDSDSAQREFMKPLIEKQQALYFEAAGAAATIASSSDVRERSKARDTFWRLYWGPLVMVESKEVSGAMTHFGNCLGGVEKCNADEIKNRSLTLASALETSLLKTWNTKPAEFTNNQFLYQ
jgi:hypothetical protein